MRQVLTTIDDRLANAGDCMPLKGHGDEHAYVLGGKEFSLPDGFDFDLMLTNAGDGILATGIVRAHVLSTCDRCLDETSFDIAGEVDEYYLFAAPDDGVELGDDEDEVDFSLVGDDHTIDLTDALTSAILMETPFVVLCREDCKGLCPICGANLNHTDCGHAAQVEARREQERMASSPFAALKNLRLEGEDT